MRRRIILMWGLPGSGKTHFVRETYLKNNGRSIYTSMNPGGNTAILALDYRVRMTEGKVNLVPLENTVYCMKMTPERRLSEFASSLNSVGKLFTSDKVSTVVIDTPCCSYDYFKNMLDELSLLIMNADNLEVEAFDENRSICKINDFGRRRMSSQFSIDNMPFDLPKVGKLIEIIKSKFSNKSIQVSVRTHAVERKSNWKSVMQKYLHGVGDEFENDSIFKSGSYSLGGVIYGIGGETVHQVDAEPMKDFFELDKLLLDLCPELPFIFYKQIKDTFVHIVEQDESDYYSKCSSAHYEIDLSKLYDYLVSKGITLHYSNDGEGRAEYDWEVLERLHR